MIDYDLNLARINIIPNALAEAVKPIEKISDIRIFDTGGLLGRGGGNGAMNGHGNGLGLGDGLAAQLLSVSAFKPIIDKILAEGGFAAGPDALTSLTNALAAQQLAKSRRTARDETMTDAAGDAARERSRELRLAKLGDTLLRRMRREVERSEPQAASRAEPAGSDRFELRNEASLTMSACAPASFPACGGGRGLLVGKRVGSIVLWPDNGDRSNPSGNSAMSAADTPRLPAPSTAWPGPTSPPNRPSRSRWPQRRSSPCCCSASAKARPACCRPR